MLLPYVSPGGMQYKVRNHTTAFHHDCPRRLHSALPTRCWHISMHQSKNNSMVTSTTSKAIHGQTQHSGDPRSPVSRRQQVRGSMLPSSGTIAGTDSGAGPQGLPPGRPDVAVGVRMLSRRLMRREAAVPGACSTAMAWATPTRLLSQLDS